MLKKVYISGKITGMELEAAKGLFAKAEERISKMGFIPVNPMKLVTNQESWEKYMLADIAILFECDTMYMLQNWKESRGARIEHNIGEETNKTIIYEQTN